MSCALVPICLPPEAATSCIAILMDSSELSCARSLNWCIAPAADELTGSAIVQANSADISARNAAVSMNGVGGTAGTGGGAALVQQNQAKDSEYDDKGEKRSDFLLPKLRRGCQATIKTALPI